MAKVVFKQKPNSSNDLEPIKLSIKQEKHKRVSKKYKIISFVSLSINLLLLSYLFLTTN
jgi:hypothetical protein